MTQDECKNLDELIATLVKYHPEANVELVEKAYHFAEKAHAGQLRKSGEPYFVHPLTVAGILAKLMLDAPTIAAGLLHDTVEDCEGVTVEGLAKEFSDRVASLVAQESEDKSKSWYERKSATIERLRTASYEVKLIGLADKLSNIRGIAMDYKEIGEEVWKKFRMKDKAIIGWYYKVIQEALKSEFAVMPAYEEYCELVEKTFGK